MAGGVSNESSDEAHLRARMDSVNAAGVTKIVFNLVGCILILLAYWTAAEAWFLLIWLGMNTGVLTVRTTLLLAYNSGRFDTVPIRAWAIAAVVTYGLSGVLWGTLITWMFAHGNEAQMLFVLCVATAAVTISIAHVAIWSMYVAFVLPVMGGVAIGLALSDRPEHLALAGGALLTMLGLVMTGRRLGRDLMRAHDLALANQSLAESLAVRSRELEEACTALERVSRTDALTGLANRRSRDGKLAAEWERAVRTGRPLSVVAIDVDHFKHYNDTYGHDAGDRCLRAVAETIDRALGGAGMAARHGGEEFMLILPLIDLADAFAVAERARQLVHGIRAAFDLPGGVTISLGVATATPAAGGSIQALLLAADAALYRAKLDGRDRSIAADFADRVNLAA